MYIKESPIRGDARPIGLIGNAKWLFNIFNIYFSTILFLFCWLIHNTTKEDHTSNALFGTYIYDLSG